MKNKQQIDDEEECIRKLARELPDAQRLRYFQLVEQRVKDPDTYAALNFLFIAGLHHFYLGKWLRGAINLGVFLCGILLMFTTLAILGAVLLLFITVVELKALFLSQTIVKAHNNDIMVAAYREVTGLP